MTSIPSLNTIREAFPSLCGDTILLENAGGSQVPLCVANAVRNHMLNDYVQLGAGYPMSDRATSTVDQAHAFVETMVNGRETGTAILGSSCTNLTTMLSECYGRTIRPGDEIILCQQGHEANIGPWMTLQRHGAVIRWWNVDPKTGSLDVGDLAELLNERTRIVAFPQVSNLLGEIVDVRAVADAQPMPTEQRLLSTELPSHPTVQLMFKKWQQIGTYIPPTKFTDHIWAHLWGTNEALAELDGPNHFFIPRDQAPYVFELGGASHEGCAGILALGTYLSFLAARSRRALHNRNCPPRFRDNERPRSPDSISTYGTASCAPRGTHHRHPLCID